MSDNAHPLDPMRHLFEWTSVRWNKCLELYELGKAATGPIVELGAYDGNGTIALALGAQDGHGAHVYGVDQWQRFTGLYQQQFYPEDRDKLLENAAAAGVRIALVQDDVERAAGMWDDEAVSLVVWDVSLPRIPRDFMAWRNKIMPGGLFVAKDTTTFDFGWPEVRRAAADWDLVLDKVEACLWGIRKPYP